MLIRYAFWSFGEFEVLDDLPEPDRNPEAKKLGFCGERSSVMLYKQIAKLQIIAITGRKLNSDVATENDVSETKGQNVARQLSSKRKHLSIGYTENTEIEGKKFSVSVMLKSLYTY